MKQSAKLAIAKPTMSATQNRNLSSSSLSFPISSNQQANQATSSQVSNHFFSDYLHKISTSKTTHTGLSVFFFMMGMVIVAKVFHHF